jgi:hypothetical protein
MPTNYEQFHSKLSRTKKLLTKLRGYLPSRIAKQDKIYEVDESGCMMIRNDLLAAAFIKGKPGFEYKERPECAAFMPSTGLRKKEVAYGSLLKRVK